MKHGAEKKRETKDKKSISGKTLKHKKKKIDKVKCERFDSKKIKIKGKKNYRT